MSATKTQIRRLRKIKEQMTVYRHELSDSQLGSIDNAQTNALGVRDFITECLSGEIMIFDISNRGLTSLKNVEFPAGVTTLYCWGNQLTSLEHCPDGVTKLDCWDNQLTSLEHCPAGVTTLDCGRNQLTSLDHCPAGVTTLDCLGNQLAQSVIDEFRKSHPRCNVIA